MQHLIILHTDASISDIGHCILAMDSAGIIEFAFCKQNYCVVVMIESSDLVCYSPLCDGPFITVSNTVSARGYKLAHTPGILPCFFTLDIEL